MNRRILPLLSSIMLIALVGCGAEPQASSTSAAASLPAETKTDSTDARDTPAQDYRAHDEEGHDHTENVAVRDAANQQQESTRPLAFNPASAIDAVPRIDIGEVQALYATEKVFLIDVRNSQAFEFEHATDSVNIPEMEIYERQHEIPRDAHVVTLCT